ncbi:MAG TPA: GNAT family N-acetyltransferase [Gaiellaceae bacterium]|nr:GNAT family N-acetyltransferase [Gaiellaceae bacterium]
MQTRWVDGITIRPLRSGDTGTLAALFARLGEESRRRRFGGPKPRLAAAELAQLARVDATRHVLVAWVDGDPRPAGVARLVRDGASAEVAFAVADELQGRGVGRALRDELEALARAAGIRELRAVVAGPNPPAVALMHGAEPRWDRGELELVVGL